MLSDPTQESLLDVQLAMLCKYAAFHFQSEELLMGLYVYPGLAAQKAEHARIVQELDRRLSEYRNGQGNSLGMLVFLMKWFINHTTLEDKKLGEFISRQRLNGEAQRPGGAPAL